MNNYTYNREDIFQYIQMKNWVGLIKLFQNNKVFEKIKGDEIASQIVSKHFIEELIDGNSISQDAAYEYYLEQFYVLQKSNKHEFQLSTENFGKLIEKLVTENLKSNRRNKAYKYALEFVDSNLCKKVIDDFEKSQPKTIKHSLDTVIGLTENKEIHDNDLTISLFKSKLEYKFYRAAREVFQAYMVFPNVAINSVIDWNLIKDKLTSAEKDYFFKGLIDCVVIDQERNYKPIRFIELDSEYHDNERQKTRDQLKDSIIGKSGHKLLRIRPKNKTVDEQEFVSLIRELFYF